MQEICRLNLGRDITVGKDGDDEGLLWGWRRQALDTEWMGTGGRNQGS